MTQRLMQAAPESRLLPVPVPLPVPLPLPLPVPVPVPLPLPGLPRTRHSHPTLETDYLTSRSKR